MVISQHLLENKLNLVQIQCPIKGPHVRWTKNIKASEDHVRIGPQGLPLK